jgi:hypothetical protein
LSLKRFLAGVRDRAIEGQRAARARAGVGVWGQGPRNTQMNAGRQNTGTTVCTAFTPSRRAALLHPEPADDSVQSAQTIAD